MLKRKTQEVSFPQQKIGFRDRSGSCFKLDYDLLVAADGTNSVVRRKLSEFDKQFVISVSPTRINYMSVEGVSVPPDNSTSLLTI